MGCEMRIRNFSERTICSYLVAIEQLSKYYNLPPGKIATSQLKAYLYHLIKDENSSVSRINQIISAWKILWEDVFHREWEPVKIKRPRREKKLPVILSREEALKLIDTPRSLKHRTILTLAYTTGIRRNELLLLTMGDIDRKRRVIRINGKGNKQREVSIPKSLLLLLTDYYKAYRPVRFLFEGNTPGIRYSESSFANVVKQTGIKAGIKKNLHPHILRHSYATHMLECGVNLKRLQMQMGHSSIKTTSGYLHLANIDPAGLPDLTALPGGPDGKE
jgi:integrase/recombinase XerD